MTDSNVVSIHGEKILPPGEAYPEVVEAAEKILEMAKSGEINGIFYALHHADEGTSAANYGVMSRSLVGAIEFHKHKILNKQ